MSEPEAFELESQTLEELADQADALARASSNVAWPKNLAEMLDVSVAVLRREGLDEERAEELARRVVIAQARLIRGRAVYFPGGEALEHALRDDEIFRSARRGNKQALALKHNLTERSIERIVRTQLLLRRARMQQQLPLGTPDPGS